MREAKQPTEAGCVTGRVFCKAFAPARQKVLAYISDDAEHAGDGGIPRLTCLDYGHNGPVSSVPDLLHFVSDLC